MFSKLSLVTLFINVCIVFSSSAFAAEVCPAVSCDCSSLPIEKWRNVCFQEETKLKRLCEANGGQPTDFCLVHGPSAQPLPLALEFSGISILPEDTISSHQEKNSVTYWSIRSDLETFKKFIKGGAYAEAKGILGMIDKSFESLYTKQQQVAISFEAADKKRKGRNAWINHSKQTLSHAEALFSLGTKLWHERKVDGNERRDKALRVLSLKVLRTASKAYEVVALGYSNAGLDREAALAWHDASDVSLSILRFKSVEGAPENHIKYYSNQVVVRLFRTSYHWQMEEEPEDAMNALQASREYYGSKKSLINRLLSRGRSDGDADRAVADN